MYDTHDAPELNKAGVPIVTAVSTGLWRLVYYTHKAGFDDLRAALANFGELDAALAPLGCLHKMLHATAPRIFPLKARMCIACACACVVHAPLRVPSNAMHMPCTCHAHAMSMYTPCTRHAHGHAHASVTPEQECQGIGEVLEKQRQQPGHGGLNLSVARDMARVEDYDRAATRRGTSRGPPC